MESLFKNVNYKLTSFILGLCFLFIVGNVNGQTYYTVIAVSVNVATFQTNCGQQFSGTCADPNLLAPAIGTTYTLSSGKLIPGQYNSYNQPFTPDIYPVPYCSDNCTLTLTATSSPSTVNPGTTSFLNASISGGSGDYTYTWDNGLGTGASKTVTPTSSTTYTVTVMDNYTGCKATTSTTVTVATPCTLSVSALSSPSTITSGNSSTLSASASGGSGNYTYSWNNNLGTGATKNVTPTSNTTYTVTVTDNNNTSCNATASTTVTVATPCTLSVSALSSPSTITSGNSSTLSASASGGSGNYTYSWNNNLGTGATKNVTPTSSTTYTVTVIDNNNTSCNATASTDVTVNSACTPLTNGGSINVTPNPATLGNLVNINNLSLPIGNTIGNVEYLFEYSLNGGTYIGITGWQSDWAIQFSPPSTGNYRIRRRARVDCNATEVYASFDFTVSAPCTLSIAASSSPSTITSGNSSTLSASASGGSGNYTYSWNNNLGIGATKNVTPTSSTTYTVTVTDNNNTSCNATASTDVIVNTCTPPTPTVNNPTICSGSSATLTVSNCAGTVTWNDGTSGTSKIVSPTTTTTYTATCSLGSCSANTTATVNVTSAPNISVSTISCSNDLLTYSVIFSSTGIVTTSAGTINNNIVENIPVGTNVTLTATASGCSTALVVNTPNCNCPLITPPMGTNKTICQATAMPSLTVTVATGLQADWYDAPTGGNLLQANSLSYIPTTAGTFYVESKNSATSCKSLTRTPISLIINPKPNISILTIACNSSLLLYDVTVVTNGILTADKGVITGNMVTSIGSGHTVTITSTLNGCINTISATKTCSCINLICPELTVIKQ